MRKTLLSIILGIGIIAILIYISNIKNTLKDINPLWIILAILVYNINWFLRGYRWKKILEYTGYKIRLVDSISITVLGNFINIITPAKIGDFVRAYILKRDNNTDISKGLASVVVDRILDFLIVSILSYISFYIISKTVSLPERIGILVNDSIYILIIGLVITTLIIRYIMKNMMKKYEYISNLLNLRRIIYLSIISVILWISELSTIIILFYSLNLEINIYLLTMAVMVANLTKALPLTPGGIGTYEATIAIILATGGLPYSLGLTIGILEHGIKNLYTILLGSFSLSYNGININNLIELKKLRSEKNVY